MRCNVSLCLSHGILGERGEGGGEVSFFPSSSSSSYLIIDGMGRGATPTPIGRVDDIYCTRYYCTHVGGDGDRPILLVPHR